jgi:hypothetical protein
LIPDVGVSIIWFSNRPTLSVTWWRLFKKRAVRTKLDIYVFIAWLGYISRLLYLRCVHVYKSDRIIFWKDVLRNNWKKNQSLIRSLVFCVMFCRSLFVLLYFFSWRLCCLSFFDLRILITILVSSNSSSIYMINWCNL